ncbi:MAG TPA: nickel-binding protein [Cyclobacteriaceae bacterium]|nr:nickel-binding protein [Cyclobacteriaceae bacterium]
MPIYMDRHDISKTITAEQVAELHRQDLKVQHRYGCRGLTYWFDEKRNTTFCLIEAPDALAIHRMHKEAHGDVPTRIIEVDASLVESFLGRIEDPDTELSIINEAAFRVIMVVDLKKVTLPKNSLATLHAPVKNFCNEVADILYAYRGSTVEKTDYHFLVSFKSVSSAAKAAFEISGMFRKLSAHFTNERIVLKMGISAGVPVTKKKLLFEDAVKLAKRMCEVIKGEMIMSAEVNYLYKEENADLPYKKKELISLTPDDEKFLTGLMDYIESAWNNSNFSVANLNKPLGCSKSKLYRKILSLTGKSPSTFIKDYRLQEALKLLEKNAGNVSEIAFETGFSSPSYFSKCFREKYGCFPSSQMVH